jgi:hypothetical protein
MPSGFWYVAFIMRFVKVRITDHVADVDVVSRSVSLFLQRLVLHLRRHCHHFSCTITTMPERVFSQRITGTIGSPSLPESSPDDIRQVIR